MRTEAVPTYTIAEFEVAMHASPDLLLQHPCIVTGFCSQWTAARDWSDLRRLSSMFGHLPVTAGAPQFATHTRTQMCQVRTDFSTYLRYLECPESAEDLFAGQWIKGDAAAWRALDLPLYCGNLQLVRHARDPLFDDLRPLLPPGIECFNDDIPYFYQAGNHLWLYVSDHGALTPLHQDNNAVAAYLAQLEGRKEAILFSPDDKPYYYNPACGYLDPLDPDEEDFPDWRKATAWTAVLEPGTTLIWGSQWAHHVRTRSRSITVSHDFVDSTNLDDYTLSTDWRNVFGAFAKRNREFIRSKLNDDRLDALLESGEEALIALRLMICVLQAALVRGLDCDPRGVKQRMLKTLIEREQSLAEP